MKLALLSFTPNGAILAQKLQRIEKIEWINRPGGVSAASFTSTFWNQVDGFVFIGAVGIAVRTVAPLLRSKAKDPAVVVLDELGRFAIPVVSGHLGGANCLAATLAAVSGGQPVITTATDLNGLFAVDVWSRKTGCSLVEIHRIKEVSGALLRGEQVGVFSDFPLPQHLPEGLSTEAARVGICISLNDRENPFPITLHAVPRIVVLGAGCRRGTEKEKFSSFMQETLEKANISLCAVRQVASIDLKADEPCILAFCKTHELPFQTYSAEELKRVKGEFQHSPFVEKTVGVDNVCERSAMASGGSLRIKKQARDGMTMAAAVLDWRCEF